MVDGWDGESIVLAERERREVTVFCRHGPVSRYIKPRPYLVFVDGEYRQSVGPGRSARIELDHDDSTLHVLAWPSPIWFLVLIYGIFIPRLAYGHAERSGRLHPVVRGLAVQVDPVSVDGVGLAVDIERSALGLRGVRQVGQLEVPDDGSDDVSRVPVLQPGALVERIVHEHPVELASGGTWSKTISHQLVNGIKVTTKSTEASMEIDAGIARAVVAQHLGSETMQSTVLTTEVSHTMSLVGHEGGSRYLYQWIEFWREASLVDPSNGEVVADITFRESMAPRTIEDG